MQPKKLSLNDLPRYSPWPARLLGLTPWSRKARTQSELEREYEAEKWGPLCRYCDSQPEHPALAQLDAWVAGDARQVAFSVKDELFLADYAEALARYKDFVAANLAPYAEASALVELAAGFGSILFDLAQRASFTGLPLLAGEFTPSGRRLLMRLAQRADLELTCQAYDFMSPRLSDLVRSPGALIYTSYGPSCVPTLSEEFITALLACHPKVVVHFEPCYEHCQDDNILSMLRKRYIEVNDYNTNLITLLKDFEQQGALRIVQEDACAFGLNPLFSASVVAWTVDHPAASTTTPSGGPGAIDQ